MKPWEKYATPSAPTAAEPAGPWAKYAAPAPAQAEPSMMDSIKQGAGNIVAGALRGAGSIGATIVAPGDMLNDALSGKGLSLESNRERRRDMDLALQGMGADPDSLLYKGGKLTGEIAGTAGAGGMIANAVGRVAPAVALANPNALNAIRTAGMSAGSATGIANPLLRAAGGAINGAVSAGMVNPEEAVTGATIGAVLPGALQVAGKAGSAIGRVLRGPEQAPDVAQAIQAARASGYVIPPTQARPTLANRLIEGFSGKISTAQNASAKNQAVTNANAAAALGLPADTTITPTVLDQVRKTAGQAYDAVASSGTIAPTPAYDAALNNIAAPFVKAAQGFPGARPNPVIAVIDELRSPQFDAASAVEKIKELRGFADTAYAGGDKQLGKAYKSAAGALEDAIDTHLQAIGAQPGLLQGFRDARQTIAKTYSVESALNKTTGTVDARKLANQLQRGKPLSGELRDSAEFASRFPKASQTPEAMGSRPQTSPLDWGLGAAMAVGTANPLMLASAAARPAARSLALSPTVQNRLLQRPSQFTGLGVPDPLLRLGYQAAPLAGSDQ